MDMVGHMRAELVEVPFDRLRAHGTTRAQDSSTPLLILGLPQPTA
jgi:hypothetical protein